MKSAQNKQALGVIKPSASLWHHRLGHASSRVVQQVLHRHKLPFVHESDKTRVCDACQQGKSHQLPYPKSTSLSIHPLDLVFSDVWGLPQVLLDAKNNHVSFIDDHTKYVWVYFLHKLEVFQCFRDFQNLVERQFSQKNSYHTNRPGWRILGPTLLF